MYIQNLMLQNFKCFDKIELEFHPELTILVGANGSGKTSIIEGAAIAMGCIGGFIAFQGISFLVIYLKEKKEKQSNGNI